MLCRNNNVMFAVKSGSLDKIMEIIKTIDLTVKGRFRDLGWKITE